MNNKTFLQPNTNDFTFICKQCGFTKRLQIIDNARSKKIKCRCGNITTYNFCYRTQYRKDTIISCYISNSLMSLSGSITNISLNGYQFKFDYKDPILEVGSIVTLNYNLPDKRNTEIIDEVKVVYREKISCLYGSEVILPLDYSKKQKRKGFWLR